MRVSPGHAMSFNLGPEQLAEERRKQLSAIAERPGVTGTIKRVLILTAVGEAATGLALLIVPSLVGQLLLGAELTGIAIRVARVAGIALIALAG
jgi:hypothetical protein